MNSRYFKLCRACSNSFNSQIFLVLNSKRLFMKFRKKSFSLVFTSSTKRQIRHFHVVVVQRRQRSVLKSVMHGQCCWFANLNQLLFCRFRCRRRRRCFSSLFDLCHARGFVCQLNSKGELRLITFLPHDCLGASKLLSPGSQAATGKNCHKLT